MEKYLKMSDVLRLPIGRFIEDGSIGNVVDAIGDSVIYIQQTKDTRSADSRNAVAEYASHAINSHDELVAMNKELLAALEHLHHNARASGAEMGLALDVAVSAIAKAKAAT